jgi:hypothetical protein
MDHIGHPGIGPAQWTVRQLVREGHGLTISCFNCGHQAVWLCRDVFTRLRDHQDRTVTEIYRRLSCPCGKPSLDVQIKRDIRAWSGVKPSSTYAARVAEWSGEM